MSEFSRWFRANKKYREPCCALWKDILFGSEKQIFWYDHPIQIGVKPEQNEVIYGLRGLSQAIEFEKARGNPKGDRITCVLSVSVTHQGLQKLAKQYLEEELSRFQHLDNIDVYVFMTNFLRSLYKQ